VDRHQTPHLRTGSCDDLLCDQRERDRPRLSEVPNDMDTPRFTAIVVLTRVLLFQPNWFVRVAVAPLYCLASASVSWVLGGPGLCGEPACCGAATTTSVSRRVAHRISIAAVGMGGNCRSCRLHASRCDHCVAQFVCMTRSGVHLGTVNRTRELTRPTKDLRLDSLDSERGLRQLCEILRIGSIRIPQEGAVNLGA
jgi:hypothetical protein